MPFKVRVMADDNGTWDEWSKHILLELKRLSEGQEKHSKLLGDVRTEIATLKVRSGVWGMIGGAIPVAVGLAIWILKSR